MANTAGLFYAVGLASIAPVRDDEGSVVANPIVLRFVREGRWPLWALARLESLGATLIDVGQTGGSWIVMSDPDGNEFCVMSTVLPPEPAPFHHL